GRPSRRASGDTVKYRPSRRPPAVALNIVVCLKQIPNPDLQFQIAPDGKDIRRDALNYKINGADEYALEEAVRLKERYGGLEVATELEGGLQRVYAIALPALLTIQFGANTPRYAPLPAIMRAARQPIREIAPASVSLPYAFGVRGLSPPIAKGHAEIVTGSV